MASQTTADGRVIPPLNINNPAPAFDLNGFTFAHGTERTRGPQLSHRAADQQPISTSQQPETEGQKQLKKQLESPGGPSAGPHPPLNFPLSHFKGAWTGNGFNMLWAPRAPRAPHLLVKENIKRTDDGLNDNTLIVHLTTEQWTFGPTLGKILNRGFDDQPDIELTGLAYMQTVQNVTNTVSGFGDSLPGALGSGIHFEPGMFLYVPRANFHDTDSIVRMASIPHGTTINAQGVVPTKDTKNPLGGSTGHPTFDPLNTMPFNIGHPKDGRRPDLFEIPLDLNRLNKTLREPQDLSVCNKKGTITKDIILNPNIVLDNALKGLRVTDHVSFEVSTAHPELTAGGTANISFLVGKPEPNTKDAPKTPAAPKTPDGIKKANSPANAHTVSMSSRFWIERVEYDLIIPSTGIRPNDTVVLSPAMPGKIHEAPTPKFSVTAPNEGAPGGKKLTVVGTQIQYSQVVNLDFGPLTWPHVSVATLVPADAQPWKFELKDLK